MSKPHHIHIHQPAHHRLYGRAKGKALTDHQSRLMDEVLPGMLPKADPTEGRDRVWIEIGFGAAHHLLRQARSNPDVLLIGAEPFLNGVAKAVTGAHEEGLTNLRLHPGDAREVLERIPDACVERIDVLYPDPWPKARHNKRRLIQDDTVAEFARLLRPGGVWRFASDITDYVDWVLMRVARSAEFGRSAQTAADFLDPPSDWVETHFERKAIREGRVPHYFEFERR